MSASTCPYCGAETRPGDNFCLNCGNRLLPSTPSPQQAQPAVGESTIPAQEGWGQGVSGQGSAQAPAGGSWADAAAPTVASSQMEPPTMRGDAQQAPAASTLPGAQAPASVIDRPAGFTLRAENGDVIQEYPLEKPEVAIGRAPNSDILLSKDKLTSRRHATVRYENGKFVLYDERSANGTFVNGEQLEEMTPHVLQDGDHVGIGEHELIFHTVDANTSNQGADGNVADMPTISVPYNSGQEVTYRTREDESLTAASSDDFSTKSMENGTAEEAQPPQPSRAPAAQVGNPPAPIAEDVPVPGSVTPPVSTSAPGTSAAGATAPPAQPSQASTNSAITFNRLGEIAQPGMPDIAPLMAALSALDGQVMSLQERLNATQEAIANHAAEVAQVSNQLREGVRRVSDRMDSTIADVARSREAMAWTDLLQLMDDVMNNPRDIDYISKLGRKARELNKVFQLHQSVLNTLAECNSLLRSLIGEERRP
jgi:pSer/pThr/pTyr-binding forkhead associated (FHA) protein